MTTTTTPRIVGSREGCVVCGSRDERALSTLKLLGGERIFVCGTHDLIYRRSGKTASSVEELCSIARDRRDQDGRRAEVDDELAAQLSAAFSRERRAGVERRR